MLAAAGWLRAMSVEYLAACAVATAAAVALALRLPAARSGRRWAGAHATLAVLFVAAAMGTQQSLARLEGAWPAVSADIASASAAELQAAVAALAGELREAAARALSAPRDPPRAFAALRGVPSGDEERATILYRNGAPEAWGGRVRLAPDSLTAPAAVVRGTFYTVLAVGEVRGDRRALATAVLHAEPPGDRLAHATDASVARRTGVRGFDLRDRPAGPAFRPIAVGPDTLLWARPEPVTEAEVRLRIVEQALMRGIVLLAAALAAFIVAVWRAAR
ncbi:MAG TPA: hypothetical protein VNA89_09135, partial [Gemmatimonadaceae bacterium]|nr:hypothetical protein [Gemmatimonadaceae bacterium]